jgi:hypothetical protein
MTPPRFELKGLRGVAILIGVTVVLSTAILTLRQQSATAAVRAELVMAAVALVLALAMFVHTVWRVRGRLLSKPSGLLATPRACWLASLVLLFTMGVVKLVAPEWWRSGWGHAFEWTVGLVALALLLLATQPNEPSSSGPSKRSPS